MQRHIPLGSIHNALALMPHMHATGDPLATMLQTGWMCWNGVRLSHSCCLAARRYSSVGKPTIASRECWGMFGAV